MPNFISLILGRLIAILACLKNSAKIKQSFDALFEIWNLEEPSVQKLSGLKNVKNRKK
jgi:hypothetical protein